MPRKCTALYRGTGASPVLLKICPIDSGIPADTLSIGVIMKIVPLISIVITSGIPLRLA